MRGLPDLRPKRTVCPLTIVLMLIACGGVAGLSSDASCLILGGRAISPGQISPAEFECRWQADRQTEEVMA